MPDSVACSALDRIVSYSQDFYKCPKQDGYKRSACMNIAMITGSYSGLGAEFLRAVAEKHPEEVPLRSVLP